MVKLSSTVTLSSLQAACAGAPWKCKQASRVEAPWRYKQASRSGATEDSGFAALERGCWKWKNAAVRGFTPAAEDASKSKRKYSACDAGSGAMVPRVGEQDGDCVAPYQEVRQTRKLRRSGTYGDMHGRWAVILLHDRYPFSFPTALPIRPGSLTMCVHMRD